jgi:sporulation protein YlmC with PRC-barrel domain
MRSRKIKISVAGLVAALAAFTSLGQASNAGQPGQAGSKSAHGNYALPAVQHSAQATEVRLSRFMDAHVKSVTGQDLGDIEDLAVNPRTGQIDYVILGRGGFFGIGENRIPVPWQAVISASPNQVTLSVERNKIQKAPAMTRNYSVLSDPNFVARVDHYYGMEMPQTGAATTPGGLQQGQQQVPQAPQPQERK